MTDLRSALERARADFQSIADAAQAAAQRAGQALEANTDSGPDPKPKPKPDPKPVVSWGPGPNSRLPWLSGCRYQNVSQPAGFIKLGRPNRQVDIYQCFSGPEQANTWDDVAGGKTDNPQEWSGVLSLTRGQKGVKFLWDEFTELASILTIRPVPEVASNRKGANPGVWRQIRNGDHSGIYRRLGRKFAGLDERFGKRSRVIIEIGHEFTGDWYAHSIHGAAGDFPDAWARIVTAIRAGYREVAGKDCPYFFCVRPDRQANVDGRRIDQLLPPDETWDLAGLSQHDNHTSACTPDKPRRNWKRDGKFEGLETLAEIAQAKGKRLCFSEWSSHHPDADWNSGPHPDIFTRSMWDFFNAYKELMAAETYFLSSSTEFAGHTDWAGTKAYRELWGA